MMLRINNISSTGRAAELLDRHFVVFKPRRPDDVFALTYISRFVEKDGTTVAGFRPGYTVDSVSPAGLGEMWALAQPFRTPEFLFMPRFKWRADAKYLIDVASETFELFSVEPVDS
jgi:hypothetical protein